MKSLSIALMVALWASCLAAQGVDQQVKKLEGDFNEALMKKDLAVAGRIMSDDFTNVGYDGNLWTKPQLIGYLKSGEFVFSSGRLSDLKVRVYADTAVANYVLNSKETFKGQEIGGTSRWTDTWVKRGNSWQLVASHGCKIANP